MHDDDSGARQPAASLLLIRGLPGSGKSTIAKTMPHRRHVEADMYHYNASGEYAFDRDRVPDAHAWCQSETLRLLRAGYEVVVCNTFTTAKEMMPYFEMGFAVSVLTAKGQWESIHNVPHDVIYAMRERWQPIEMLDYL